MTLLRSPEVNLKRVGNVIVRRLIAPRAATQDLVMDRARVRVGLSMDTELYPLDDARVVVSAPHYWVSTG